VVLVVANNFCEFLYSTSINLAAIKSRMVSFWFRLTLAVE